MVDWNLIAIISIPLFGLVITLMFYRFEHTKELREVKMALMETLSRFQRDFENDKAEISDSIITLFIGTFRSLLKENTVSYNSYDGYLVDFLEYETDLSDPDEINEDERLRFNFMVNHIMAVVSDIKHSDLK